MRSMKRFLMFFGVTAAISFCLLGCHKYHMDGGYNLERIKLLEGEGLVRAHDKEFGCNINGETLNLMFVSQGIESVVIENNTGWISVEKKPDYPPHEDERYNGEQYQYLQEVILNVQPNRTGKKRKAVVRVVSGEYMQSAAYITIIQKGK